MSWLLPHAPTSSSPVLGLLSPMSRWGRAWGDAGAVVTGGWRWGGWGGPQGGGTPAGVPWGCCRQVNNSSTHKAGYSNVFQPRAGNGGVRLVLCPPLYFCLGGSRRGRKVSRSAWPRALAVLGLLGAPREPNVSYANSCTEQQLNILSGDFRNKTVTETP